jgi:hypothetical protein
MARYYVAITVPCAHCAAKPQEPCTDGHLRPPPGVHRERDMEYNRRAAAGGKS